MGVICTYSFSFSASLELLQNKKLRSACGGVFTNSAVGRLGEMKRIQQNVGDCRISVISKWRLSYILRIVFVSAFS